MSSILRPFVFGLAVLFGIYTIWKSSSSKTATELKPRSPSSVIVEGPGSREQMKQNILSQVQATQSTSHFTLALGSHYLQSSTQQESYFICEEWPRLEFIFEGEGIEYSEGKPQMSISTLCLETAQGAIQPLVLPLSTLFQQPPQQMSFGLASQPQAQIELNLLYGEWPTAWVLREIRFYTEQGQKGLIISQGDLIRHLTFPIGFTYSP